MRIYKFPPAIIAAIKKVIDDTLPDIKNNIVYLDYEPAENEISALPDETVLNEETEEEHPVYGAISVYVRDTTFPSGSQNGTWKGSNIIEIDTFGFSKAGHHVVEGKTVNILSTKRANLISQSLLTASFLATTDKSTLTNSFGVVDHDEKKIKIGEKLPVDTKLYSQGDIQETKIAICIRKLRLQIDIEETTLSAGLGPILAGFNKELAAFNIGTEEV
jgi:hypothetical protein